MSSIKLDITKGRCSMAFVKAKLQLEQMENGDILEILRVEGASGTRCQQPAPSRDFRYWKRHTAKITSIK